MSELTFAIMGGVIVVQAAGNLFLIYWHLRAEGRIKPVSVEKAEAAAKTPVKTGRPFGGRV